MILKSFDAHTHVQFAAYNEDRDEVIKRALDAGVGMVNVGTEKDTSKNAVELTKLHENVWAAVGLHPTHVNSSDYRDPQEFGKPIFSNSRELEKTNVGEKFNYEYYKRLAENPKVIAIGECGLDYYRVTSDRRQETSDKQKEVFLKQIELSHETRKPLMIHCRSAFSDLIEVINSKSQTLNSPPGTIHFFSGTKDDAKKLLDLGFYFTFGGVITFPPRLAEQSRGEAGVRDYDEVIKMIPIDRILSETDAPYVTPVPYRGKRNEPAYVIEVVKKLAELKGVSLEEMAAQIIKNAEQAFEIGFDKI